MAYQYAADGTKLRKHAKIGTQSSYTYYINGIEYTSMNTGAKSISFINNEIGNIKPNGSSYIYQFDISDNTGNNLLSINQNIANNTISIAQINSYYSFGNTVPYIDGNFVSGRKNNHLYNGKELQEETGLYDYHARMYDPAIGRWQIIDPLSESFYKESPYNYVLNNPINLSDPTGMYPYGGGTGAGIDPYKRIKELNYEAQTAGVPDWVLRGNNFQDFLFFEDYGYSKQDAMEREIQYKQWESLNSYKYWNPNEFYIRSMGLGFENFDNGKLIYNFELVKGRPTQKELYGVNSRGGNEKGWADNVGLADALLGPLAGGADNILKHRGMYLPKNEVYRVDRKIIVRTPIANIRTTSKVLNYARVGGKVLGVAGVAATGYQIYGDFDKGNYYSAGARTAVAGIAVGAAFMPIVGWGVTAGIGVADYVWGDQFYNYIETKMK